MFYRNSHCFGLQPITFKKVFLGFGSRHEEPNGVSSYEKGSVRYNNVFKNRFILEREIDYDESIIECYGRQECKQFISGKPIRFGYKAWCINKIWLSNKLRDTYIKVPYQVVPAVPNVKNVEWDFAWTVFLNFIGNR
nr:unnamed protein product [Callosobruchus chinensis]